MKSPLISVVTLTYNKFEYIYKTIDSVLCQDYPYIEYIIADDGSKNFPKQEIVEYIEKNKKSNIIKFKILTSEINRGTVKNINRAYKCAKGEILFPLSGDDLFYNSEVISNIVSVFQKRKCDVLVTSRMAMDQNNNKWLLPSKKLHKYISRLDTAEKQHNAFLTDEFYNMASGSALYIRKSFLNNNEYFDEKYTLWEDGPFLTKYTKCNKIETNYSIISILYRLGGISNCGENPLMRQDRIIYNKTDRKDQINEKKWILKEKINYICKRYNCKNKIELIILYLRYPLVITTKILFKLKNI